MDEARLLGGEAPRFAHIPLLLVWLILDKLAMR